MTPFPTWRFIFPPRTSSVLEPGRHIARDLWDSFPDVIGQFKENGTRNMTVFNPDGTIVYYGRGKAGKPGGIQKQFTVTAAMREQLDSLGLERGKLHVLDGEFIHAKTKMFKDVLYLFDILIYNSQHLIGETYGTRYELLDSLVHSRVSKGSRYFPWEHNPSEGRIYMAQNFPKERWDEMYQVALNVPYCEGVVLKRMGSISQLEYGSQEFNNSGFMTRMRKPNKNYTH